MEEIGPLSAESEGVTVLSRLAPILDEPTGESSSGYPFLGRDAWERFRDTVPHTFRFGLAVLRTLREVESRDAADPNRVRAARVVRQVVRTATITAPPVLWLLRHVLGAFAELGLLDRLIAGEGIYPSQCEVVWRGKRRRLEPQELDTDLRFLLSVGLVEQYEESFRVAGHPRVRQVFGSLVPIPPHVPAAATQLWRRAFAGDGLADGDVEVLLDLGVWAPRRRRWEQNHWIPTVEEIELGYRLVPVVLALRACDLTESFARGRELRSPELSADHPSVAAGALEILNAAGWMERTGDRYRVTEMGERGFARAPGPFGIIESYHGYMARAKELLLGDRGDATWVRRSENVGASQDANRSTFQAANDALDRFCRDRGFAFDVFIEHAIGRGEATRQRFERSGDELAYVGADLEDAAIDAAMAEQAAGELPADMLFVRRADIGRPEVLLDAMRERDLEPEGAVMLVGNGFHEIRDQTDDGMVEVFGAYERAGVLLLFTEENALSIDDLRATAWNTYHAGFKYVHEKSGQGLRPAESRPASRLGRPLRAAWSECAVAAGYVRADAYSSRTRTIYPYPPPKGHNPAISVNHFFVPGRIASRLGLV